MLDCYATLGMQGVYKEWEEAASTALLTEIQQLKLVKHPPQHSTCLDIDYSGNEQKSCQNPGVESCLDIATRVEFH